MKKQHRGIIFIIIFGGGLLFWATAATIPGSMPGEERTLTGTPADNYADIDRAQFCGGTTGPPGSNRYITEYDIPTECTQPRAITTDPRGTVWFAQTNTGKLASFDPISEEFTEYENPRWPDGINSDIWGIAYAPDNSLWYTDPARASIWRFGIDDGTYSSERYPISGQRTLPQQIEIVGTRIITNDLLDLSLRFVEIDMVSEPTAYETVESPIGMLVSGFDFDSDGRLWYTSWIPGQGGTLFSFDYESYFALSSSDTDQEIPASAFTTGYRFPFDLTAPNGLAITGDDMIWMADAESSNFFSFDPVSESFTRYTTPPPPASSYGNATGIVLTPISRPYWMIPLDDGRIAFTEQTANRIGVMDPASEKLVEYVVPSNNPYWADCQMDEADCGIAQVFGITAEGGRIWFTEWAENRIGVLETSVPAEFDVAIDRREITVGVGQSTEIGMDILADSAMPPEIGLVDIVHAVPFDSGIVISYDRETVPSSGGSIRVTISADDSAFSGTYKILLGAHSEDIAVSEYVTVSIVQ